MVLGAVLAVGVAAPAALMTWLWVHSVEVAARVKELEEIIVMFVFLCCFVCYLPFAFSVLTLSFFNF